MSHVLTEAGYRVRSADDGFTALLEINQEMPDILLSDLNMPGISGFELLSVVRSSFPSIRTVAMSGSFSGDEVPSGVAANAFYEKGCSFAALLKILQALHLPRRIMVNHPDESPIWIDQDLQESFAKSSVAFAYR
jgi:CheY-like chemotaxis protein